MEQDRQDGEDPEAARLRREIRQGARVPRERYQITQDVLHRRARQGQTAANQGRALQQRRPRDQRYPRAPFQQGEPRVHAEEPRHQTRFHAQIAHAQDPPIHSRRR